MENAMPATVSYKADSLEDIAKHFEEMAERAASTASRQTTNMARARNNAESRTWTEAASFLRSTTIGAA